MRDAQALSLLGPAFALGVVPDMVPPVPQPSVASQCLQGLSKLGQGEALKTQQMLRAIMRTIHDQLHTLAMHFLGSKVGGPASSAGGGRACSTCLLVV